MTFSNENDLRSKNNMMGQPNKFHGVDDFYFDRVKIVVTIRMMWKGFALGGVWIILAFSRG